MEPKTPTLTLIHPQGRASWQHGPVRVGRAPDNHLVIEHESLSRHHLEIRWENRHWIAYDLESANGFQVNGRKKKRHVLQPGDQLVLGAIPVTVAGEPGVRRFPWLAGLMLAVLLLGFAAWFIARKPSPPTQASTRSGYDFATAAPPTTALTPEQAIAIAEQAAAHPSGRAWAAARRALWSITDTSLPPAVEPWRQRTEKELEARFRLGRAAYRHAVKTGDTRRAQQALRSLRETFPVGDPRSFAVTQLERRP